MDQFIEKRGLLLNVFVTYGNSRRKSLLDVKTIGKTLKELLNKGLISMIKV